MSSDAVPAIPPKPLLRGWLHAAGAVAALITTIVLLVENENPQLQAAHVLTLSSGMRTLSLSLWDEEARRVISFRQLAAVHPNPAPR